MTTSAPSDRANSTLAVETVVSTRAPYALANWTAKCPTPPEPPWIKDGLTGP